MEEVEAEEAERLRREAEARLRAKFGNGGLKGQSVSNFTGYGNAGASWVPPAPICSAWRDVVTSAHGGE